MENEFIPITGTPFRILKYLSKQKNPTQVGYGSVSFNLKIESAEECRKQSQILLQNGLAESEENKIWITQKGTENLELIIKSENDDLISTINDSYDFTILKYLYNKNQPISFNEFPEILIRHVPKYEDKPPEISLLHRLGIGELKKYIKEVNQWYEIRPEGKIFVEKYLIKQTELESEKQLLRRKTALEIEQLESVINTNRNVQETNNALRDNLVIQNRISSRSFNLSILTVAFIAATALIQILDKTPEQLDLLRQEVERSSQGIQQIEPSLEEINSSMQILNDSLRIYLKRRK